MRAVPRPAAFKPRWPVHTRRKPLPSARRFRDVPRLGSGGSLATPTSPSFGRSEGVAGLEVIAGTRHSAAGHVGFGHASGGCGGPANEVCRERPGLSACAGQRLATPEAARISMPPIARVFRSSGCLPIMFGPRDRDSVSFTKSRGLRRCVLLLLFRSRRSALSSLPEKTPLHAGISVLT